MPSEPREGTGERECSGSRRAAAPASPLLRVRDLVKHFSLPRSMLDVIGGRPPEAIRAVDGVSFDLTRGTTLGLVGESGCGKSTLGRCLLRLHRPDGGAIWYGDADLATLEDSALTPFRRRMQVVLQDPYSSLDPRQTVGSALTEVLAVHGIGTPADRPGRVATLLGLVGLGSADAHKYPGEFSGGQRQRISIARALAVGPELLVADEPVSALDVSIQAQILRLLLDLRGSLGLTMMFISHDLRVVRYLSDEVAVMYLGKIVEQAPAAALFARPLHPYTLALLSAIPEVDAPLRQVIEIEGEPPSAVRVPPGCRFHPRCPWRTGRCLEEAPVLRSLESGHLVACHEAEKIGSAPPRAEKP